MGTRPVGLPPGFQLEENFNQNPALPAGFSIMKQSSDVPMLTNVSNPGPTRPSGFEIQKKPGQSTLLSNVVTKLPQGFQVQTPAAPQPLPSGFQIEKKPKEVSLLSRVTRAIMGTSGGNQGDTTQFIYHNRDKMPAPIKGESWRDFAKRANQALQLPERETQIAAKGTMPQLEDLMMLGVGQGLLSAPKYTAKMLGLFTGIEAVAEKSGLNEKIANIPNATVKDVADIAKFGIEGIFAGTMAKSSPTKWLGNTKAVLQDAYTAINKRAKGSQPAVIRSAKQMVTEAINTTFKDHVEPPVEPKPPEGFFVQRPPPPGFTIEKPTTESVAEKVKQIQDLMGYQKDFHQKGEYAKAAQIQMNIDRNALTPDEWKIYEAIPVDNVKPKTQIPDFKNPQEAITFGKTIAPEQKMTLREHYSTLEARGDTLRNKTERTSQEDEELLRIGEQKSRVREAIAATNDPEVYKGIFTPQQLEKLNGRDLSVSFDSAQNKGIAQQAIDEASGARAKDPLIEALNELQAKKKFTGDKDIAAFGEKYKDAPGIVEALKSLQDDAMAKAAKIKEIPEEKRTDAQDQEGYNLGVEAQKYREALQGFKEAPKNNLSNESGQINTGMIPGVQETADLLVNAHQEINQVLRPASIGEGQKGAQIFREKLGQRAQAMDRLETATENAHKILSKTPQESQVDFIDRMEHGKEQADPALNKIAKVLREQLDLARTHVQELGTGKLEEFYVNYFPRYWKKPGSGTAAISGLFKKPLEGRKEFLKKRTYEYFKDGLEAGLTPESYNPVDFVRWKIHSMEKYVAAHRTLREFKGEGLAQFIRLGQKAVDGWVKIDDKIATVYSRNEKGELILRGHYYAQPDAARILNNYLSAGLSNSYLFNAYRGAGNTLNLFQLGLSAFHLGFTSLDAAVSRVALGFNKIFAGQFLPGLKEVSSFPAAPITNIIKGHKLYNAWFGKDSSPEMQVIADVMASAGGRARMDKFYSIGFADQLKKNLNEGKIASAIFKIPIAAVELASKPMMEWIVPRQKLGVFADLVKFEMEKKPNMSHEELRATAQKIWDSVDNRMGQMVYDNLFWNRTTKDLAMASVRSVGWNLGTIRELGGGIADLINAPIDVLRGKKPEFTYRMSYLIALPFVSGILGAIYQYLATGEGPQELKDYYFPRTGGLDRNGNPNRVSLPSYMKDIYHYGKHPVRTVMNKLAPQNAIIFQMLSNKDFYGTKIRNEDDPIVRQFIDEIKYVGKQFEPFGVRNAKKESYGQPGFTKSLNFVGITPAPYDINMTPAEEKASEILGNKVPVGSRTKEQFEEGQKISSLRNQYRVTADRSILSKAMARGEISVKDAQQIMRQKKEAPLLRMTKSFTVEEMYSVFKDADMKEKDQLKPVLQKKIVNKLAKPAEMTKAQKARILQIRKELFSR